MVLEAGDRPRALARDVRLDRDVADQSRAGLANRLEIGEPEAGEAVLAELIAVAEQLIATADGEHGRAVVDRSREGLALGRLHVGGDRALVAVLAASDVEEIVGRGVDRVPGTRPLMLEVDSAPLRSPLQEDDVAAIGVDVHLLGVEREDSELHQGRFSSSRTTDPTWMSVAGICRRPTGVRPASRPSASIVSASSRRSGISSSSSLSSPAGETFCRKRRTTIAPSSRVASSGRLE